MEFIESSAAMAGIVVCGVLLLHTIFARRSRDRSESADPRLSIVVFAIPIIFAANWLWLALSLPLIAWAFWIGDNEHWFYNASNGLAALAATISTVIFAVRFLTRNARRHYARIQILGAISLLLLWGAYLGADTLKQVQGWSPESAARRVVRNGYPYDSSGLQQTLKKHDGDCYTYEFRNDRERKMQVTICRFRRWFWRAAGSRMFVPHPNVWDSIAQLRKTRPELARKQLQRVIEEYPDSEASARARKELTELEESP